MASADSRGADAPSWRRTDSGIAGSKQSTPSVRGSSRGRGRGRRAAASRNDPAKADISIISTKAEDAQQFSLAITPNAQSTRELKQPFSASTTWSSAPDKRVPDSSSPSRQRRSRGGSRQIFAATPVLKVDDVNAASRRGNKGTRALHRRTKSAAMLKPTPIAVPLKAHSSASESPITPVKDLPPHLVSTTSVVAPLPGITEDLDNLVQHVRTMAMESHGPSTPGLQNGHIDWAEDSDDTISDLDDWGITLKPSSYTDVSVTGASESGDNASDVAVDDSLGGKLSEAIVEHFEHRGPSEDVTHHTNASRSGNRLNTDGKARRRGRGREREREAAKLKTNLLPNLKNPLTTSLTEINLDEDVPRLPSGQKRSLLDRIGPQSSLKLPSIAMHTSHSPPKSPSSLPHHPSLPTKPMPSPSSLSNTFDKNTLSPQPMSQRSRSASRSRSPSKPEKQSFYPVPPLPVLKATGIKGNTLTLKSECVSSGAVHGLEASIHAPSHIKGDEGLDEPDASGSAPMQRPVSNGGRSRTPRSRNARNTPSGDVSPFGSSRRGRQQNGARPVVSLDALQRISKTLQGSNTPPRHSSPVPGGVSATAN